MLVDYHVHTDYSDDSDYHMEDVVVDAIRLGLDEVCFTDHVDYGIKWDWGTEHKILYRGERPLANVYYPQYIEEITELQYLYGDKICIRTGLEFGVQTHTIPLFRSLYSRYPFDFIILSIHQIEDKELWTQDFQKGKSQREYNEKYYEEMLSVVQKYKEYSVLGHLDLIARYDENGVFPFQKIQGLVETILKNILADGKGIEVNTSCYQYGLPDTTPSIEILKLYRELGGKIITIGSDSHEPKHLGSHIKETQQLLKSLGYTHFCTYEKMSPIFHNL